jgi:hypothetical protein
MTTKTGTRGFVDRTAHDAAETVRSAAQQARRIPGLERAEGEIRGALGSASDLAIPNYDSLTAPQIVELLSGLPKAELAKIDGYERRHQNRKTVLHQLARVHPD